MTYNFQLSTIEFGDGSTTIYVRKYIIGSLLQAYEID